MNIGIEQDDLVQVHGEERTYLGTISKILSDGKLHVSLRTFEVDGPDVGHRAYGNTRADKSIVDGEVIVRGNIYAKGKDEDTGVPEEWRFHPTDDIKIDPDYVSIWQKNR